MVVVVVVTGGGGGGGEGWNGGGMGASQKLTYRPAGFHEKLTGALAKTRHMQTSEDYRQNTSDVSAVADNRNSLSNVFYLY